jgi:hypothetical protein
MLRRSGLLAALTLVLPFTGCGRGFFTVHGSLANQGGPGNTWRTTPEGCTRDPFDGKPSDKSTSILTLLWQNPAIRNPHLTDPYKSPDAPLRLEFSRSTTGVTATLHTRKRAGIALNASDCTLLRLDTEEHPPRRANSLPSLSGTLALQCHANRSDISADLTFTGCQY